MKKMRIHIYILLGVLLTLFIIGSFSDLEIDAAIFSRNNPFGLAMSVIGTVPGYGMVALIGGGFFALFMKKLYKTWINIAFLVLAIGLFGVGIFFSGREFFGPNGFTNEKLNWVGYLIALPIMCGCSFLGYYLISKSNKPHMWIFLLVIAFAAFMALVPGVTLLKIIFHRPRFRSIEATGIEFHNWWQRCSNYKELMATYNLTSEEFKSFPSGHSGASAVFLLGGTFLPFIDKKYERLQLPIFYGGVVWMALVMFSRMLVGAHFLSDVSMGAMISVVCLLITNEIVIHNKMLNETAEEQE